MDSPEEVSLDSEPHKPEGSAFILLKQSLQYTGRSPFGRNGTMASLPHSALSSIVEDPEGAAYFGGWIEKLNGLIHFAEGEFWDVW